MLRTSSRILSLLLLLAIEATLSTVRAQPVQLQASEVRLPGADLKGLLIKLDEPSQSSDDTSGQDEGVHFSLSAARADLPALGWRHVGLQVDGLMRLDAQRRWRFDGAIKLNGAPGGALSDGQLALVIDEEANTLQAELSQGDGRLLGAIPLDQPSHVQINLDHLPAGWLQGLLGTVWSGHVKGGKLDADMALDLHSDGLQASGQFALDGVAFDTPTGTLAGEALSGSGRLGVQSGADGTSLSLDGSLHGGQLLLGPLYARLPAHPVQLAIDAFSQGGALELRHLRVGDADALQLDGALAFDARGGLRRLKLDHLQARFPAAYQRYGESWLSSLGLRDMRTDGQLEASIDLEPEGLRSFAFNTDRLDLADGAGRLAVDNLRGGLDWTAQDDRPATTLGWRSLRIYRIPHGAALSHWRSQGGQLSLQQPLEVPLLDGRLRVGSLEWRPAASKGQRLQTSLVVTGVNMAAFSRALGWPAFSGTLAGALPSLCWVDDRIELQGGLSLNVFDGFVDITRLAVQQPFGEHPMLAGDVRLKQLDLAALTGVFDFGSITGRLNGAIDQLRLADWRPVAFDAHLLADGGGRISQRAVNNLTSVGGGGLAGGLQGAMLKLFKNFGYRRLGLSCTLQGNVCRMGGLDGGKDGYTIVDGSGLPHLKVIGHQTEVDWPTLLERLEAASQGGGPEIR